MVFSGLPVGIQAEGEFKVALEHFGLIGTGVSVEPALLIQDVLDLLVQYQLRGA